MKKVKTIALLLCLTVLWGACGVCEADQQNGVYTAGVYTASARGQNGSVTLSVTFSDGAIESIEIGEHQESAGISDSAFELVPSAIVQYQSLGVDVAAGATVTSNAILEAVADCVTQAGGDAQALKAVAIESVAVETDVLQDSETDVLVIGGGGAGLAAALSASENGAKVILIEKLSALGGTTILSSGSFNAVDPDGMLKSEMTESAAATVESYLATETQNEEHATLKALV